MVEKEKKMNIIVFDTETVGMKSQSLLNIGYKICDVNIQNATAETLIERNYLVTDLINNRPLMINDMFVGAEKYEKMLDMLANGGAIKRNIPMIFSTMANDIARHKVLFGYAYNCCFDTDKFEKTATEFGIENPLANLPIFDIWGYAGEWIINTPDYIKWAKENEMFTETERYIKTSVEAVTSYLENNLDFVEEHTALSDVQWETKILLECVKRGVDITKSVKRCGFIKSEKEWTKTIVLPNGDEFEVTYKKMRETEGKIIFTD
jgi:hypothetical protein